MLAISYSKEAAKMYAEALFRAAYGGYRPHPRPRDKEVQEIELKIRSAQQITWDREDLKQYLRVGIVHQMMIGESDAYYREWLEILERVEVKRELRVAERLAAAQAQRDSADRSFEALRPSPNYRCS